MDNKEVEAKFESLKKDLGKGLSFQELVQSYLGIFFLFEYATTTKQTEYLLRIVLSNRTVMETVVETIENLYEFKENVSEDVSDKNP
ncbi:hypothetical protein AB9M93_25410 [Peribacillus frigoritolerans]|uniref:hypothetical protein n=1 Tax=Peribacillus frigoritolerans TaxID=450367 RepID=UPI003516E411